MRSLPHLTLKHVTQHTTYSFTFEGCDSLFEWTTGSSSVMEISRDEQNEYQENFINIDCVCKDNIKSVIRSVRLYKEREADT